MGWVKKDDKKIRRITKIRKIRTDKKKSV